VVGLIPEGVKATALAVCRDIGIGNLVAWPEDVATAILAERQRCSEVVDSWSTTDPSLKTNLHFVAAAILNP